MTDDEGSDHEDSDGGFTASASGEITCESADESGKRRSGRVKFADDDPRAMEADKGKDSRSMYKQMARELSDDRRGELSIMAYFDKCRILAGPGGRAIPPPPPGLPPQLTAQQQQQIPGLSEFLGR